MQTLNLVNKETSEIKYEVSKFPDGQQQVTLIGPFMFFIPGDPVNIKARLNNFLDLELIVCAVASLRGIGVKEIHLCTPYFEGSRSDRKFEEGSNNYLKDVICPIVNSLKLDSVTVLDPHSDVLEMGLNNYKKVSNLNLVEFALGHIYPLSGFKKLFSKEETRNHKFILLSPDAGASKKIYKLAEEIGYTRDIITCSKDRDKEGKLTKTIIPDVTFTEWNQDMIIIDDICDGGATFINMVKAVKEKYNVTGKFYLVVTHGIFSKGFEELSKHFDGIYCTNSYSDLEKDVLKAWEGLETSGWVYRDLVKQLNVF